MIARYRYIAALCLIAGLFCASSHAAVRVYRAVPQSGPAPTAAALAALPATQVMTGFAADDGKPAAVQTRAAAFISRDALTGTTLSASP